MKEKDRITKEKVWIESNKFATLLKLADGKASGRKLRLLTCACCRVLEPAFSSHTQALIAIDATERFLDGKCSESELAAASRAAAEEEYRPFAISARGRPLTKEEELGVWLSQMARWASDTQRKGAASRAAEVSDGVWLARNKNIVGKHWQKKIASILRDVVGNPYRPVALDPRWLSSTVLDLARTIYDERVFERLPVLAESLMDAGCDNEEILKHCRSAGPHVRGCWVVDLLLGKE